MNVIGWCKENTDCRAKQCCHVMACPHCVIQQRIQHNTKASPTYMIPTVYRALLTSTFLGNGHCIHTGKASPAGTMSRSEVFSDSGWICKAAVSWVKTAACFLSCTRDCSRVSLRDSRQPFNTLRRKSVWCPITCIEMPAWYHAGLAQA